MPSSSDTASFYYLRRQNAGMSGDDAGLMDNEQFKVENGEKPALVVRLFNILSQNQF
jgi:hypothetical protein